MSFALDEFFAAVEDEFSVAIGDEDRDYLPTPGAVVEFVAEQTIPQDGMDEDEHREHISAVIGELMARTLGVTRYRDDSRFEDLHLR
ncbi:MAG TPA: hypothetical protein VJU87_01810 [Gemmatimonadaceae bacterium]|nr:hypothetical protein [Gemmatimonadaceae bacterium]